MESYLSNNSKESLEKIINYIKNTKEYQKVKEYKKKMHNKEELMTLIEEIKLLQKKYVKSSYNKKIKEELDIKLNNLNNDRDYLTYNYYLEKVNEMIDLVKNEFNDYFENITNHINLD